jgi:hypothetical protein
MSPSPKRQHFNPILHLKHFVGSAPKGQVWTYDAQTGSVRPATPANTAVQSHFYSVERDDGSMDTTIEEFLSEVESRAAPIYEGLLQGQIPTRESQARVQFANFLALMHVRTPAMRRMAGEVIGRDLQIRAYASSRDQRAFDAMVERAEKNGFVQPLNQDQRKRLRQDLADPSGYAMQVPKERTLSILGAADKLTPLLANMTWSVVAPMTGFFITTDNPLIRDVDPKTRHPIYGDHGFANKTAEVIFSLSPARLLFMSWNTKAQAFGVFEREHVDGINQALAAHSDRFLYSPTREKRLQDLAAKFKDSRPTVRTLGFGPTKFATIEVTRRTGNS